MIDYNREYETWIRSDKVDEKTKAELIKMSGNENAIKEAFCEHLAFGTGGLRGIMGAGISRMNIYTIRRTTQGIADFILDKKLVKKVAITYDTRNNSKLFATEVCKVLVANNIEVYLTEGPRPTPFLSYLVRYYKTGAGINITASHNTKEYNGYKFYLSDGAQVSYPDDENVINYVNNIKDIFNVKYVSDKDLLKSKLYHKIDKKPEVAFRKDAESFIINKKFVKKYGKDIKIVYTPLHGVGSYFLKDAFKNVGFTNVSIVKSQDDMCGDFKTVASPNPEKIEAWVEAINLATKCDADIIVATDPDADRMGVYVKIKKGIYKELTGNQMGAIMLEYISYFINKNSKSKKERYAVKSFVTTRLLDDICRRYGTRLITTLTGFKWIGKAIEENKNKDFVFATEESIGFLVNNYVRDKDSIASSLIILEIALVFKKILDKNLYDFLNMLYGHYGARANRGQNIEFPGLEGKTQMKKIMTNLRNENITHITDIAVIKKEDYLKGVEGYAKNDTFRFYLADGSMITIRPSGTEPKIKLYYDCKDDSIELAENKIDILMQAMTKILNEGERNAI